MSATINPARLADEVAADAEVLLELAQNGDIASLIRPIDVHFKGDQAAAERLAAEAGALGFTFIDFGEYEDGDIAVDLQILGSTEPAAMAALAQRCLEIKLTHAIEYDGWGCAAVNGTER